MEDKLKNRTLLHKRHRLSHQQIDKILGEESGSGYIEEKRKLLNFTGEFLNVCDLLDNNLIPFISIKGPALSYRIYGDPAVRVSHDIDLIIGKERIDETIRLLLKKGFSLSKGVVWPANPTQRELILESVHHVSLTSSQKKITLEIHWTLMQGVPVKQERLQQIISENIYTEVISGRRIRTLAPELELLFLMIHGSRHSWSRLKWLVDLKDYNYGLIEVGKFNELAKEFKAGRIIAQTNLLLKRIFGTTTPFKGDKNVPRLFSNHPLKSINSEVKQNPSFKEMLKGVLYKWFMFSSLRYRIKLVSSLFLRNGDLEEIDSRSKLSYIFYRPYSIIKRRLLSDFITFKPLKLLITFLLTLLNGFTQGITIVLLIPLLSLLDTTQAEEAGNGVIESVVRAVKSMGIELNLVSILLIYSAVLLLSALLAYARSLTQVSYQQEYLYSKRKRLYKKVITSDWSYLNSKSKHNHIQVLTSDIPKLAVYYHFFTELAKKVLFIVSHTILALLISWKYTLFVSISGASIFFLLRRYLTESLKLGAGNIFINRQMLKEADDFWTTVKIAKAHNSEEFYFNKFNSTNRKMAANQYRQAKNRAIPQLLFTMAGVVLLVIFIYLAYERMEMPLTSLFVLILLFARIFPQFMSLNSDINNMYSNREAVKSVNRLENELEEREFKIENGHTEIELRNRLEIRNLTFAYTPGKYLFKNFSASFEAKSITGIMGKSGAGKTTLIDIITGILNPGKSLYVDGLQITEENLPSWRSSIGYLPQDSFFIDGTIRDNLVWDSDLENDNQDERDKFIIETLRSVNAEHLIKREKRGLDTYISNYNYHFSGGERQRLALARVLLRKPRLLLLDEATSALDSDSEREIMESLQKLKSDITIIFITHKPTLKSNFDKSVDLGVLHL